MENIRGIHLHNECLESANYPVTVDLKLTNAVERFDYRIEQDFLGFITSLTISADWAETSLSLLQYTTRLQKLILSSNNIEKITGKPFYFLNNLESLDLSNNQLTNVDELFQFELHPNKLFKLSLAYNRIEELPGDVFEELTSLIELDLSYNKINNINEEPFSNLTSLETLRLNNNLIKNLNGAVNNLHILKNLYLRDNQIQNIDVQSLKIITHLETFDVSRNQLEKINSIVFLRHWKHLGGKKICKIILSDNHINVLPNTSKEISARYTRSARPYSVDVLTEVDLSNNEISDIEYNAFQSLFKMISLDLSRNKIIDFVVNADDLEHVKYLNLSGNYIVRLYFESFSAMKNLQNLDLSHNYLDYIPDQTFTNTYNLKNVNMTYNEIAIIKNLHIKMFHPEGGVLDLSNNGLNQLKIPFGQGLRLTILKLHSNNISIPSLIDLIHQTDLMTLDLSKNMIIELNNTSLRLPVNLLSLDLRNKIIDFVVNADDLEHVKYLNLSGNYIVRLYFESFSAMKNLQNLDLSHNYLDYIPDQTFTNTYNLKNVNMTYNEIAIIKNLHIKMFHPEGGVLDLSNNGLNQLKIPFGQGLRLTILKLHSNNISIPSLIDLIHQTDLMTLDLSKNMIIELNNTSLRLPVNLLSLDLSCNMIRSIGPSTFHRMGHLKTLRLSRNKLSTIEYGAFQGLTVLQNLDLSFNEIKFLDSKLLMDLKLLSVLSLRSNGMLYLNYKSWYGHKHDLKVFVDGNFLTCEWLVSALNNFNNGFSKMRPAALVVPALGNSVEGIPCVSENKESEKLTDISSKSLMDDDRLLVTSQKILEAVREQTYYLRKYSHIWPSIFKDTENEPDKKW
ncbi:hypothetical protein O3G_MSEX012089 [Manduca sexta]|uniref:Uncharacterized protein n=2 Tax=Manduca sexta TaxID=7130 RepID=A0A922CW88_MANSE|nr:hypothetical protein O3G_MSEX012089 [Manduca sexta]